DTSNYDTLRFLEPAYARHENIQYVLTNAPDSIMTYLQQQLHSSSPFTRVVGPTRTAAGSTVYLYRMPGANPIAWVAGSVVKGSDDQALATVTSANFDPARAAILDSASTLPAVSVQSVGAAADAHATATHYEPGMIEVHLDKPATAGQALVVSENYFPGWHATADGKAAPLARMNYNLIGVELPAGASSVRLSFSDAAYGTGKIVTLVALLVAVGRDRGSPRGVADRTRADRCRRRMKASGGGAGVPFVVRRALIIVPTYNERENVERIVAAVLAQDARLEVLVVDDGSPDGTGDIVEATAASDGRVHLLRRERKMGLGT